MGRRHPDLMMSFFSRESERQLEVAVGEVISCIKGLVELFSLNYCVLRVTGLANPGLPKTWRELKRCSPICCPAAARFRTIGKVTTILSLRWSTCQGGLLMLGSPLRKSPERCEAVG